MTSAKAELPVKIGIIGSGNIGGTLARLFAKAGHEVFISNSRGPQSLTGLVNSIGPNAKAVDIDSAVIQGDVIVLALPWRNRGQLPASDLFDGKVVIDATNAYTPEFALYDLGTSTSSEEIAKLMPGARVVKAFNTLHYKALASEGKGSADGRLAIFLAGDDARAKQTVSKLIQEIGFAPVDTGSLREGGRRQQPDSPIYNNELRAEEARKLLATV